MHYLITYLSAHARATVFLRAPNAAAAVTMAQDFAGQAGTPFELLSVTLLPEQGAEASLDPGLSLADQTS